MKDKNSFSALSSARLECMVRVMQLNMEPLSGDERFYVIKRLYDSYEKDRKQLYKQQWDRLDDSDAFGEFDGKRYEP